MLRKALTSKIFIVLVTLMVTLLACEVVLRIAGVRYDASLNTSDPVTGWALRPYAAGWWVTEGDAYVRINSDGMHDREYPVAKPPGTYRIAVLGDSTTAAVQVDREENFGRFIEAKLSACRPPGIDSVEAMNFGVPGFGTAQELLTLKHKALKYEPDAVLLAFYPINDVQNNHRAVNPVGGPKAPYYVLEGDELVLDDSFRSTQGVYEWLRDTYGNLVNRSRLLQMVAEALVRGILYAREHEAEQQQRETEVGGDVDRLTYGPPERPEMVEAWNVTEALILEMDEVARDAGARLFVGSLTVAFQHAPDAALRYEMGPGNGWKDPGYPDRRLSDFAAANDIPFLALESQLREQAEREDVFISFGENGWGHYNEDGHRMIGDALGAWLCEQLDTEALRGR